MFKCSICLEKDKRIDFLEKQVKDLLDRLMAFNEYAFNQYREGERNEPLFPIAEDKDGKIFSYKDQNSEQATKEVFRAMGEDVPIIDEPDEKEPDGRN